LRPWDRVAVKPYAAPIYHAIQYRLGRQTRDKLENFRGYKGAQSYPSRSKDTDDVDFTTGSVGLGVAQTLFASLVQDYVRAHGWSLERPDGRMIALLGDAELDEDNIFESMLEGWKQGLRNCWWFVDFNRQSLDGVVREGLWEQYENLFRKFGWDVVVLKYDSQSRIRRAVRRPQGQPFRVDDARADGDLSRGDGYPAGSRMRRVRGLARTGRGPSGVPRPGPVRRGR
jgi:pyruvate dehydrogenase E1 component